MISSFEDMVKVVKKRPKKTIACAMAESEDVLQALSHANEEGLADAVLVGNKNKIEELGKQYSIDISNFDIIHTTSEQQSVVRSIQLVREHLADVLMKGNCSSATLLKGVLDKDHGVRSGKLLSHVAAFDMKTYHKLLFMSDGGMNIAPEVTKKIGIIENAVLAAKSFGIRKPKVALLAAIEKVNYEGMPCTVDAAILTKMAQRGQIKNAVIDGPLALDNAISHRSCEIKGIRTPVGGEADVLIVPNIESGNIFYKALNILADCKTAGIILGAKVPIVLTSRADTKDTKFYSIALGMITSTRTHK